MIKKKIVKTFILSFLLVILIGCGNNMEGEREKTVLVSKEKSLSGEQQLPNVVITKAFIETNIQKVDATDVASISSEPIPLLFAYYTANSNTADGKLKWYISATGGSLAGYIFSLGNIETINGVEKVSWREVSSDAASVNLVNEKVVVGDIADNTTHTFLDWGLGVEKNYESIQEDIELIRNTTVNVLWWFFQAPNDAWYIIDKSNHIYKFEIKNGEYDWQQVDTSTFSMAFYMEGGVKKIKLFVSDTTPPILMLNGESNVSVYIDQVYTEYNATATDNVDGNVSASIVMTGSVDTASLGSYILTYTATDGAGNEGNITRTVNVLSNLRKTGQTTSFDVDGNVVADGTQRDDGYYQKGATPSFTRDDANETVTDNLTGLMWQDDSAVASITKQWLTDANYDTCRNDTSSPACLDTTGDTATTYCSQLVMGGHEDWRLPTSVELEGIVNYGARNPAIDSTKFNNTASSYYWSSTSIVGVEHVAWIVNFNDGYVLGNDKNYNLYVRCVRE